MHAVKHREAYWSSHAADASRRGTVTAPRSTPDRTRAPRLRSCAPMSDAPPGSFLFDPRDLITGPFDDCPECKAPGEFGLLMVTGRGYVKRCRRCMSDRSFELPALNKRVIYLDQHAISHLAKAIHPDYREQYWPRNPRTQDGFWPELFARLNRLNKLHLAVCPESTLQRQESLLDDRLAGLLRTMYEHLAGEVAFYDHYDIERFELSRAFVAWLDREPVRPITREDVIRRDIKVVGALRVTARLGLDDLETAEARTRRIQCNKVMEHAFASWRADERASFDHYFAVQIAEAGNAKFARWPFSDLSLTLRRRLEDRDVTHGRHSQLVAEFLKSSAFAEAPLGAYQCLPVGGLGRRDRLRPGDPAERRNGPGHPGDLALPALQRCHLC
jgi:hypothetical protein